VELIIVSDHVSFLVRDLGLPEDFRGVYDGTTIEGVDEDAGEDAPAPPPTGTIYLNAANLRTPEDVSVTLYHEVGHALGLDEDEVAALNL